jgi:hypothetical protein
VRRNGSQKKPPYPSRLTPYFLPSAVEEGLLSTSSVAF